MYAHRPSPQWTVAAFALSISASFAYGGCASGVSDDELREDSTFSADIWAGDALDRRRGPSATKTGKPQPAAAPDATWTTIANELGPNSNGAFSLSGTQTILYGADGHAWIKMEVTGPGECSNEFFRSDPAHNVPKVCKAKRDAVGAKPERATKPTVTTVTRTPTPTPTPGLGQRSDTLRVSGRTLLDTCGQPFVARGIENFLWKGTDFGPSLEGMVDEIAKTGANAVRLLPALDSFGSGAIGAVDRLISTATSHGMVVYLSVGVDKRSWFAEPGVKQMLEKHKKWLIVDIYQEATYDDRPRWKRETLQAIREFRQWGYTIPVTMMANQGGRDLSVLLSDGDELVAADRLKNSILGWQAYWGGKGFYMDHYGMSLQEALDQIAALDYPIQLGLLLWADGNDALDYKALMTMAEEHRVGWLWWDFFLPPNTSNSLSTNGKANALSALGRTVVHGDPYGIARTAKKACGR